MEGWTGQTGKYMMLLLSLYKDRRTGYLHTYILVYDFARTAGQDGQVDI